MLACFSEKEGEAETNKLIPPAVLIEMCLRGGTRKLALLAFEMFAWMGSSFRNSNQSLLEESWRNAADQDDWVALANARRAKGWSDELVLENLRETILFAASYRCYGPEAKTYNGGFNEVLPLRKDEVDFASPKESGSSVETILMQHKNFPDAGKLMLTAIMMGREGVSIIAEADGELAMES